MVIDIGKDKTEITPIIDFQTVSISQRTIPYGSTTINKELKRLLPDFTDTQIEYLKQSDIFQALSEEAAKASWFGLNTSGLPDESAKKDLEEDGVVDIAAIVSSGRTREILAEREKEKKKALEAEKSGAPKEDKPNEDREFNYFESPDSDAPIKVGKERFQGTKLLVEKIALAVGEVLKHLDETSKRQECWDNIIIVGRGSAVKGLKEAIYFELQSRYIIARPAMGSEFPSMFNTSGYNTPTNNPGTPNPYGGSGTPVSHLASQAVGHGQVPTQIKISKHLDYFIEWKNYGWEEASFLGAEIAAKQIFGGTVEDMFITRTQYNMMGPAAIWDI